MTYLVVYLILLGVSLGFNYCLHSVNQKGDNDA